MGNVCVVQYSAPKLQSLEADMTDRAVSFWKENEQTDLAKWFPGFPNLLINRSQEPEAEVPLEKQTAEDREACEEGRALLEFRKAEEAEEKAAAEKAAALQAWGCTGPVLGLFPLQAEAKKKAADAKKSRLTMIEELLNKRLLVACGLDDATASAVFLQKGACVNCRGKDGRTPLIVASAGVRLEDPAARPKPSNGKLVELLLSKGADVHAKGKDGITALAAAAYASSPSCHIVEALMAKGAKCTQKELQGISMKFAHGVFATKFPLETLAAWLKIGANVETLRDPSAENETPLYLAAQGGKPEVVQLLLDWGANMKALCGHYGVTPLRIACIRKDVAVAKILVDWAEKIGYDVQAEDEETWALWLKLDKARIRPMR